MTVQPIFLIGPTAVGKTKVAILLAKRLGTEIVSADSMQIYKGMDIGTAKPSREERKIVKHYMIDVAEPTEDFSVGEYLNVTKGIIDELCMEDRVPLVVGGTGLYIRALTRGLFKGPKRSQDLRMRMEDEERIHGKGYLHLKLRDIDPEAALKIHPADLRRIIRAIEVYYLEKRRITELQEDKTIGSPYNPIKIGLTMERDELYRRIEKRVEGMISNGLVEEVNALLERGCHQGMTSMQGLGYKHFLRYIKGEYSHDEAIRLLKRDTKRYAKRQFTWFRKEEGVTWIDVTGYSNPEDILGALKKEVEKLRGLL